MSPSIRDFHRGDSEANCRQGATLVAYIKRIVCLANSIKTGGTCVAGREVVSGRYGQWIRPVSARPAAEVSPSESRYNDQSTPKVLDIIDVPVLKPAPQHHQTENHVIDTTRRWVKVDELPWTGLAQLCEQPASLWINSYRTRQGIFNCISQEEAATLHNSLALIQPGGFAIRVGHSTWNGKSWKTYRGRFTYNGTSYVLVVTDPIVRKVFAHKAEGDYPVRDVYICVSLTEPAPQDGRCHKLVAAVMSNPPL